MLYGIELSADDYTPTDADWQEFCEWLDSQEPVLAEPDAEPTAEEWADHVVAYLADHNLSAVPF